MEAISEPVGYQWTVVEGKSEHIRFLCPVQRRPAEGLERLGCPYMHRPS